MPLVILSTDHQGDDFDLDPQVVAALWDMEDNHFWHPARNAWIRSALRAAGVPPGAAVLDVGCGSGAVARDLEQHGYRVAGIDTAEPLVRKAHERCPGSTFVVGDLADLAPGPSPFAPALGGGSHFDAVGFFDVLEHLDHPMALVAAARPHLRPGGVLVATVPSQRALHSVVDDLSGHKTRYERGELGALLREAGLVDVVERGIFRLTLPLVRRARRGLPPGDPAAMALDERRRVMVRNLRPPPGPVNRALAVVCAAEQRLGFRASVGRPGASLLVTARFPD